MSFARLFHDLDRATGKDFERIGDEIVHRVSTLAVARLLEIYTIERDCYKERHLSYIVGRRLSVRRIVDNDSMCLEWLEAHARDNRDFAEFVEFNREDFPEMVAHIEEKYMTSAEAEAIAREAEQEIEHRRQCWVAVAMARHRRLGSDATMGDLDSELVLIITARHGLF